MNKIILQVGFLFFFLSMIFFSQRGFSPEDILIRSFTVFIFLTVLLSLLAIYVIKSINRLPERKSKDMADNILGNSENE